MPGFKSNDKDFVIIRFSMLREADTKYSYAIHQY